MRPIAAIFSWTPRHNFLTLPRIRTESPAFDLHHPDLAQLDQAENTGKRDVVEAEGHKGRPVMSKSRRGPGPLRAARASATAPVVKP